MSEIQHEKIELGEKLRGLRKQHSYTQEDLAQKMYVSRQTVYNWEKGKVSPDKEMRAKLCELYNIPLSSLIEMDEVKAEESVENTAKEPLKIWQDDEQLKKALLACAIAVVTLLTVRIPFLGAFVGISGLVASRKWGFQFGWLNLVLLCCVGFGLFTIGRFLWELFDSIGKATFRWTI